MLDSLDGRRECDLLTLAFRSTTVDNAPTPVPCAGSMVEACCELEKKERELDSGEKTLSALILNPGRRTRTQEEWRFYQLKVEMCFTKPLGGDHNTTNNGRICDN